MNSKQRAYLKGLAPVSYTHLDVYKRQVVYDAVAAAKARDTDILLVDTAGRLHNKKNLMDELAKMRRIITRDYPEANVEALIVLDGTTGQNALEPVSYTHLDVYKRQRL